MRQATPWAVLLTIALGTVIAILTLSPPSQLEMPAGSDKSYHFLAFLALVLPLAVVRPRWGAVWFVVFTAYGAAIEIVQPYVGRSREVGDLFADMGGIVCGLVMSFLVHREFSRRRNGRQRTDEDSGTEPSGLSAQVHRRL